MKALVFVGYFPEVLKASRDFSDDYRILLITEHRTKNSIDPGLADEIVYVNDFTDQNEMEAVMREITGRCEVEYLYANIEWAVEVCGYLRDKFTVKGLPGQVCVKTRDKYFMKRELQKCGIDTAKVECVKSRNEVEEFIKKFGYPIILKPRKGAATQNTFFAGSDCTLGEVLKKIDFQEDEYIAETFVNGEEYHCDSIVSGGKVIFSAVSKYYTNLIKTINTDEPVAAVVYPKSADGEKIIANIKDLNRKVVAILGITSSICHMEVFVQEDGHCVFGEIASRIGGGPLIGNAIHYAYGFDFYRAFIELGIKNHISIDAKEDRFAGYVALPVKSGEIVKISAEEDFEQEDDIKMVRIFNKAGDVVGDKNNTVQRSGYFIVTGTDAGQLRERLAKLYRNFVFEVREQKRSIFKLFG